ncbi:sensor histidine kinase, partial [Arthrobacter sp. GCM10027362]|uniref:sensor histidine kinase n=1 Tax=Arthrobacter sp. GCM10027362 TaxID=3273379 RepID=UPI003635FE3A
MALGQETAERTAAVSFTELAARRRGPLRRFLRRRPVVMDALVVGAYLLLSAATLLSGHPAVLPVMLAVAAVLLFRRRWPVAVLAVLTVLETALIVLQPTSQSATVSLWFALYAVALTRPARLAVPALVAASLPPMAAFGFFLPDLLRSALPAAELAQLKAELPYVGWVLAAFVAAANLIATGIGSVVRRDRQHEEEVARWAAGHARLASAAERTRIARDMHDVVAHSLSVMIALSDGAAVVVRKDPERAGAVLEQLSTTGRTALADMRRVLGVLRGDGGA